LEEKMNEKECGIALKNARGIAAAENLTAFPLSELMAFLKAKGLRYKTGGFLTGHRKAGEGSELYISIALPYGASSVQLSFVSRKRSTAVQKRREGTARA
jgi:hypothetical protein